MERQNFTESDLEKSILTNLQKFLMELGKGYAFVVRQQRIHTEKQDYFIQNIFSCLISSGIQVKNQKVDNRAFWFFFVKAPGNLIQIIPYHPKFKN